MPSDNKNWRKIIDVIAPLAIICSIAYGYGCLTQKVIDIKAQITNQSVAINNLTKSLNCHIAGGAPMQCIDNDPLNVNQ
jgi:hypothetical protein